MAENTQAVEHRRGVRKRRAAGRDRPVPGTALMPVVIVRMTVMVVASAKCADDNDKPLIAAAKAIATVTLRLIDVNDLGRRIETFIIVSFLFWKVWCDYEPRAENPWSRRTGNTS